MTPTQTPVNVGTREMHRSREDAVDWARALPRWFEEFRLYVHCSGGGCCHLIILVPLLPKKCTTLYSGVYNMLFRFSNPSCVFIRNSVSRDITNGGSSRRSLRLLELVKTRVCCFSRLSPAVMSGYEHWQPKLWRTTQTPTTVMKLRSRHLLG